MGGFLGGLVGVELTKKCLGITGAAGRCPRAAASSWFLAGYLLFCLLVEFLKPAPALAGLGLTAMQGAGVGG